MKHILSEDDQSRIRDAVSKAEKKTSGEIVPHIARQSAGYEVAVWRAAAIGGLAASCVILPLVLFYPGWSESLAWLYDGSTQALAILAVGGLTAALTTFVPSVKRTLAGRARMTRSVHLRAMQTFIEKEVFNTRDRTGILLFVSLFEHRIEVVGDAGINSKVTPEDWSDVVLRVREGIKAGKLADGLVAGINLCGALLEKSGVDIRADDTNELSDEVSFDA